MPRGLEYFEPEGCIRELALYSRKFTVDSDTFVVSGQAWVIGNVVQSIKVAWL